jgi:quercetin dioxygenase-like cupin family protein
MKAQPMIVNEQDYVRPFDIVGEHVTVLASGEKTDSYEIFYQQGPEGSGPPPHNHPWDEAFFILKGDVEFGIGEEVTWGAPGTLVHLPAGTVHWFRFGKGGAVMISITSRLGASKMFEDFDREISPTSPDLGKLIELASLHGCKVSA